MKNQLTAIVTGLFFLFSGVVNYTRAQNGLENIIVEKYYICDANDTAGSIGRLAIGSVTYRIYVDMLPGYKFQAAYGLANHELRFSTSTSFFNNEDRGATTPNYSKNNAKNNTIMLDSWLTVGAACNGNFGILKSEDNGVANVINANGLLQNTDALAGIPLTTQDGLIAGTVATPTFVGFTNELEILDATSFAGNLLSITNASWASMYGTTGPTANNRVLIAQITTDGVFHFELNIQLLTPVGERENYVAKNPVGSEILFNELTY